MITDYHIVIAIPRKIVRQIMAFYNCTAKMICKTTAESFLRIILKEVTDTEEIQRLSFTSFWSPAPSFHLNRLPRAHFLAAEAPDAFFIIINRWLFFAVSEIDGFAGDGAAVYADSAADAFVWLDVGFLLENI